METKEFDKILQMFHDNKGFDFDGKNLQSVCNAPKNKAGIYIFFNIGGTEKEIIYIGCSGHIQNNGKLSIRTTGEGGLYGRIVNGHQFDKDKFGKRQKRHISMPLQMKKDRIYRMRIEWYVTHNDSFTKSPCFVESWLLQTYFDKNGRLPKWNKKF